MTTSFFVRKTLVACLMTVALSLSFAGLAGAANATPDPHESHHPGGSPTPDACAPLSEATPMSGGIVEGASTPVMNVNQDFDLTFIDLMIPHHESAIAMAKIALVRGEHQEIRTLAQNIVASQQAELDQMRTWRDAWYPGVEVLPTAQLEGAMNSASGTPPAGMDSMSEMSATMDPAGETNALCNAAGSFDRTFMEMMIPHHRSAVAMANAALQHATHAELKSLAKAIVSAQDNEITQMTGWLLTWFGATPAAE